MLPDGKLLAGKGRFFTGVGAAPVAPELGFTLNAGGLELAWPAAYKLQKATTLQPANWQDTGAATPFTVPLAGPGEFYRVVPALLSAPSMNPP